MKHQLSNFELDLIFIAASMKRQNHFREEYWQKMEEKLKGFETDFNDNRSKRERLLIIIKLKYKRFKKLCKTFVYPLTKFV